MIKGTLWALLIQFGIRSATSFLFLEENMENFIQSTFLFAFSDIFYKLMT